MDESKRKRVGKVKSMSKKEEEERKRKRVGKRKVRGRK